MKYELNLPENLFVDLSKFNNQTQSKIGRLFQVIETIKESTEFINFQCNFNKDGLCHIAQKFYSSDTLCCCKNCLTASGYLRNSYFSMFRNVINLKNKSYYYDNWNNLTGFWRKNKGCILPRKLRSAICLIYNCLYSTNPTSKERQYLLTIKTSVENLYLEINNLTKIDIWKINES